ncbi:hypothetical protein R84B8_02394 [Treponema sp. R8-4-B8]
MQEKLDNKKSQKNNFIYSDICNTPKSSVHINNIFVQRILAYRHGTRYYRFPHKEKILPICS